MPDNQTNHQTIPDYQSGAETLNGCCSTEEQVVSNPKKLKLIRLFRILRTPLFWLFLILATALKRTYSNFIARKSKIISSCGTTAIQPLYSAGGAIVESDPEKKENDDDLIIQTPNDQDQDKAVECNNYSETTTDQYCARQLSSLKFKEGEHIAAMQTVSWFFSYAHHGVVLNYVSTPDGQKLLQLVTHFQRPCSQSHYYECECGYKGPSKDGGLVSSCLECFYRGSFAFKIQHISKHLLSSTHPKWRDDLKPGKVLYQGYCNYNFYLGYFLGDICHGYLHVKRNDHYEKPVDNRVRFVETIKCSKVQVLEAARNKTCDLKSYSLLWNNCEHIAMLFMTGERRSFQLENCPRRIIWKIWKILCYYFQTDQDVSNNVEIGLSEPVPDEESEEEEEEEEEESNNVEIGPSETILDKENNQGESRSKENGPPETILDKENKEEEEMHQQVKVMHGMVSSLSNIVGAFLKTRYIYPFQVGE